MEPLSTNDKLPVRPLIPVAIPAPSASDGAGVALRRAFPVPGALPEDLRRLLREIDEGLSRSVAG
jgi:hypothetical protein